MSEEIKVEEKKPYSLYLRNGVYYVRMWDPESGKYSTAKTTKKTDLGDAQKVADKMLEKGQLKTNDKDPYLKDDLIIFWKKRKGISDRYLNDTLNYIEKEIKPFLVRTRNKRISELSTEFVDELANHIKDKKPPRTANRILQVLKVYFHHIRKQVKYNYADDIDRAPEKPRKRGNLDSEEIWKITLLEIKDKRLKAAALLSIFASMRKGEIKALRWKDVDFMNNTIHIRRNYTGDVDSTGQPIFKEPKADSKRKKPYMENPFLKNCLLELYHETPFNNPDDLVLVNVWGVNQGNNYQAKPYTPIADVTLKRGFKQILEAIGIPENEAKERNLVFHSLRHTFGASAKEVGSTATTASLGGWSTSRMVDNYGNAGADAELDVIRKVAEKINSFNSKNHLM